MTNPPEPRPPYVTAMLDQIQAALRDKDGDRFAQTVRLLYLRAPTIARAVLREGLRCAAFAGRPGQGDLPEPEE